MLDLVEKIVCFLNDELTSKIEYFESSLMLSFCLKGGRLFGILGSFFFLFGLSFDSEVFIGDSIKKTGV